ncbi:MAG: hypothetical protein FD123_1690 [Bacteroidetes bacterium]|nr:MAG: hypothetical protein FD123_1690 [Bacteroidota bacterium]
MKNFFFCILCTCIVRNSHAQINITGTSSQALPAFFIIDKEPKSVATPSNPRKLAASILNAFDQEGGFNPDVGIEFAPYWLRDSSRISLPTPNPGQQYIPAAFQSLAFSIASAEEKKINSDISGRVIGLGFRIHPALRINVSTAQNVRNMTRNGTLINIIQFVSLQAAFNNMLNQNAIVTQIRDQINIQYATDLDARVLYNTYLDRMVQKTPMTANENATAYIQRLQDAMVMNVNISQEKLYDNNSNRRKFNWEVAGATGMRFPTNEIGFSYLSRVGIWTSVSYSIGGNNNRRVCSFNGMARILSSFTDSITTNYDAGISFTGKWWPSLPFSLEFVGRRYVYEYDDINQAGDTINRIDRKNTYRLALTADFAIDEDLSLNFTFGRDYDKPFQTSGNLLGIIGLNYTFGTRNKLR